MAQPEAQDIFGQNAYYDESIGGLLIGRQALLNSGLNVITDSLPIPILASILKTANTWLESNQDEAVKAASSSSSSSPVNRNGIDTTEFTFTFSFYGNYQAPLFVPDEFI